jgi:uncharacterized protein YecA (UPF0149 family)
MTDNPPQYPDFLNITPQPRVTFEELDDALKAVKDALPTAYAIGVIYGSVCAPHMVPPSVYLPEILGRKMELSDPPTAERVLSLLHSLHNQLAAMIEDNQRLKVRRTSFDADKEGLMLHASDLWREAVGFRKALSLGTFDESDFPKSAAIPYFDLGDAQDALRLLIRRISMKRKPYSEQDLAERQRELVEHGNTTARLMQTISSQLYLQRVNKYKAQGVVRIGRNDPCPCGSGKKFKNCCIDKIKLSNRENN